MKTWYRGSVCFAFGIAVALGVVVSMGASEKSAPKAAASPKFTVVETDGAHVVITNNQTNTLFFYAIEKEGKIGDPLNLRGSLDLNDVGKPVLTPKTEAK